MASIVQSLGYTNNGAGKSTITFPSPITAGNLIVISCTRPNASFDGLAYLPGRVDPAAARPFTILVSATQTNFGGNDPVVIMARRATGDEQSLDIYASGMLAAAYELANATSGAVLSKTNQAATTGDKALSAFGSTGVDDIQIAAFNWGPVVANHTIYENYGSGWTGDHRDVHDDGPWYGHPGFISEHATGGPTAHITGTSQSEAWGGVAVNFVDSHVTAAFTATPSSGDAPLSVAFDSSGSTGSIVSYAWDFGDGGTGTTANPTHVYVDAGPYTATLTVTGASDSDTASASIEALEVVFTPYARDKIILSIRASFTDDNLYNHAIVVATGDKNHTYYAEKKDTDPLSPTRISAIGDRVFVYESDIISTQDAANMAVQKVYRDNCVLSEDVEMDALCNPALEGNDIVGIDESSLSKLNITARIRSMTIPFSSSRQTIRLGKVINLS